MANYIETDCLVTVPDGRTFSAGGAVVTDDRIIAYPKEGGLLADWHGRTIGRWVSTALWQQRGVTMYQIEAVVDGRRYTGRGQGAGMVFSGRRKRGKA